MLHVLLEPSTPRARFVVRHVLERMIGWPIVLVGSWEALSAADGPRLYYGNGPIAGAFHVPCSGALSRTGVDNTPVPSSGHGSDWKPYPIGNTFDVFAAIFQLLSLADEYGVKEPDEHGRLRADDLAIVKADAHHTPLCDVWCVELAAALRAWFPSLPPPARAYQHVVTVDVDNGLKYAARSFTRAFGASAKDIFRGKSGQFMDRWRVRTGLQPDPYARFIDPLERCEGHVSGMIAFILMRGDGRFDHAARPDHPIFRAMLERLSAHARIGIHPSYESSRADALIIREREQLARLIGKTVNCSRQHFLRWRMPETFRTLITCGIQEDHSIGFSDRAGFRAGTCTPFPWFDPERDQETGLMLHPFATMDSALARGTGAGAVNALSEMRRVCDAVREVQGTYVSVWHDRFLSDDGVYSGSVDAFEQLVDHARP